MKVIAYDAFPAKDSGIEYVSLDDLFEKSDIISLHCPLTEDTKVEKDKDKQKTNGDAEDKAEA